MGSSTRGGHGGTRGGKRGGRGHGDLGGYGDSSPHGDLGEGNFVVYSFYYKGNLLENWVVDICNKLGIFDIYALP